MLKKLKNNEKGFTIIEVMIVLAIAALILLIVLLAVPALKRNSDNTTMKNDVSTVAGGISEYESNNGGALPGSVTGSNGTATIACSGVGCTGTTSTISISGSTKVVAGAANTAPPATGGTYSPGANTITVYLGYDCATSGGAGSSDARAISLEYPLSTSGGQITECQQA